MFWFVSIGGGIVALVLALWPLVRRMSPAAAGEGGDLVAFYRARLETVEAERAAGAVEEPEAEALRAELGRKLLAANAEATGPARFSAPHWAAFCGLAGAALLGATAGYMRVGKPDLPDAPIAERAAASPAGRIEQLVALVEAHLKSSPDDGEGWAVLASAYVKMGRFDDAVAAFENLVRIRGETADRLADLGEARLFRRDGVVDEAARKAFGRAVELDPKHQKARYYLGLAAERDGDRARAREIWSALAADAGPESDLAQNLKRRLARLDAAGAPDRAPGGADGQSAAGQIAALPAAERAAAIRGMVEGLAARLKDDPGDFEGWLRLIRSRVMLGERDRAQEALNAALKAAQAAGRDPGQAGRLGALAKELGLEAAP